MTDVDGCVSEVGPGVTWRSTVDEEGASVTGRPVVDVGAGVTRRWTASATSHCDALPVVMVDRMRHELALAAVTAAAAAHVDGLPAVT